MLKNLLNLKLIEFPKIKHPKEVARMDDLKYYNYHRLVSHLVEQCIALKDTIMELAHQGKSDLEEDVATSKFMLETY